MESKAVAVEGDLLEGLDARSRAPRYAAPGTWKRLRKAVFARTTLAALGPKVGLSASSLCRKLNGKVRLRQSEAHAIVAALGGVR